MPLYAFECGVCGTFEERRPLAESSSPSRCPVCMGPGRRLYTPPGLVRTPAHVRQARHLEEKSAHASRLHLLGTRDEDEGTTASIGPW